MIPLEALLALSIACAVLALCSLVFKKPALKLALGAAGLVLAVICALGVREAYAQSGGPDELSDQLIVAGCYAAAAAAGLAGAVSGAIKLRKSKAD